jgi:hypothetical protein
VPAPIVWVIASDGDFGKYFHLPVSVNFSKWILFTGKLPVNQKKIINTMKKLKIQFINGCRPLVVPTPLFLQ